VVVLASGDDRACRVDVDTAVEGMEGADCADQEDGEQAVLLVTEDPDDPALEGGVPLAVTVVQPNEDGSYWRKIVRNKMVRMKEKRRVQAASYFAKQAAAAVLGDAGATEGAVEPFVVSSWGPYTSISGTAKVGEAEEKKIEEDEEEEERGGGGGYRNRLCSLAWLALRHAPPPHPISPSPEYGRQGHHEKGGGVSVSRTQSAGDFGALLLVVLWALTAWSAHCRIDGQAPV
jgi:hypothetical protein